MVLFDCIKRQRLLRNRASRWTFEPIGSVRLAKSTPHVLRHSGSSVQDDSRQESAVQPEDRALREEHGTLDEVLQLADIPRPGIRAQEVHEALGHRVNLLAQLL